MLDYLQKYSQLPEATKQRFSSPIVVSAIKELEKKYQVVLGAFIIRLLVGEVSSQNLADNISREFAMPAETAQVLADDLKRNIFSIQPTEEIADYLPSDTLQKSVDQVKDVDQKMAEIIANAKINFASRELEERFKKILSTYLRGIRDKINAKESLMKDVESGGLGFDVNSATAILSLAKDEPAVTPIKQPASWIQAKTVKPPIARDIEYDLAASIKARQAQEKPTKPILSEAEGPALELEPPVPAVIEPPIADAPAVKDNRPRMESGKIKMEDIQISPKIYTPVDELKYMTVKNFRNLSQDPVRAMEIVKKKIEVLGQEDYGKKVAGVQGWKVSPVNRMYIEAYQEAITAGKSVENILAKRRKDNPDYITADEFEAILAFNQAINKLIH
jgi:hypothetical protein